MSTRSSLMPRVGDVVLYKIIHIQVGSSKERMEVKIGKVVGWHSNSLYVVVDMWNGSRFRGRTATKTLNIIEIGKTCKGLMRDYPEYFI